MAALSFWWLLQPLLLLLFLAAATNTAATIMLKTLVSLLALMPLHLLCCYDYHEVFEEGQYLNAAYSVAVVTLSCSALSYAGNCA